MTALKSDPLERGKGRGIGGDDENRLLSPGVYHGPSHADSADKYDDKSFAETQGRRVFYENFTSIDFIHDFAKERVRLKALRQRKGLKGRLLMAFDASQAWILVFLIGSITGLLAGFIVICSEWLSDLKEGYCSAGFYLNKKFCCWGNGGKTAVKEVSWFLDCTRSLRRS